MYPIYLKEKWFWVPPRSLDGDEGERKGFLYSKWVNPNRFLILDSNLMGSRIEMSQMSLNFIHKLSSLLLKLNLEYEPILNIGFYFSLTWNTQNMNETMMSLWGFVKLLFIINISKHTKIHFFLFLSSSKNPEACADGKRRLHHKAEVKIKYETNQTTYPKNLGLTYALNQRKNY